VSIYEDCTERWLAVRAKALYNSYVFTPCMIIWIVWFLAKAFPKVFSCVLCIDSSSFGYCSAQSLSFQKWIVEVGCSINLPSDFQHGIRAGFVEIFYSRCMPVRGVVGGTSNGGVHFPYTQLNCFASFSLSSLPDILFLVPP